MQWAFYLAKTLGSHKGIYLRSLGIFRVKISSLKEYFANEMDDTTHSVY